MSDRTRFRLKRTPSNAVKGYQLPGDPVVWLPPDDGCITEAEGCVDVVGNAFNFNPVSHIKLNSIPGTPGPFTKDTLFPPSSAQQLTFGTWLPFAYDSDAMIESLCLNSDIHSPLALLDPGDAASFTRSALDKALNQVPEEISIANFLFELREVKSLIPRINGWKTVTDGFLNWNFGWLPLIQDIKAMLSLVSNVRKRLEHLKRVNRRTITVSHSRTYVITDDDSPIGAPEASPHEYPLPLVSKTRYHEVKVSQHMSVSYDLDLYGADAFLQAMCSALGLMNPAKIVWNAIPFSFVLDWFIHLGSFLDSEFGVAPFKGTIKIRSATCSYRTKTFVDHFAPSYYPSLGERTVHQFGTTLIRGYHRRHGTPEGTIEVTGLTPFQQALAAALIASNGNWRLPSRRRRKSPKS